MISLTWSAIARTSPTSVPITRNCTGYGTGGPFGSSFTRPRTSGKSFLNSVDDLARAALRAPSGPSAARRIATRWSAGKSGRAAGRSAGCRCRPSWSRCPRLRLRAHEALRISSPAPRWRRRTVPSGNQMSTINLGPARIGEELLLDEPEAEHAQREHARASARSWSCAMSTHQFTSAAKAPVERRVEQLVVAVGAGCRLHLAAAR